MKKKVLIINTVGMGFEGISSVIVNYIRNMDHNHLCFDFVVFPDTQEEFLAVLKPLGNIHLLPERKKDVKGYMVGLNRLLKNDYDVIHVHGNSGTMLIESVIARWNHVKRIIVHGHNTTCNHPHINRILTPIMKLCATDLLACSVQSGQWLYGTSKHMALNNAIDLARFSYNEKTRAEVRNEFGVEEEYVVGHMGNFIEQKNHSYLIDVFSNLYQKNPSSRLLLVSDGPNMEEIKHKVRSLNLQNAVIFAGRRKDAERLYQAMDIFVMPSRWEGLPLVALEAQASGLPVVLSDRITEHVKCTDEVYFLNIEDDSKVWADKIDELLKTNRNRQTSTLEKLSKCGFNIVQEAEKLKQLYMA